MDLEIIRLALGPLANNVYVLGDHASGQAVVIDPGFDSRVVLDRAAKEGWELQAIWLTHGHFDHIAGAGEIALAFDPPLPIGLHPADAEWFAHRGGADQFGFSVPQLPEAALYFQHGMALGLSGKGDPVATVRCAPGHSRGHVMFYCELLRALFCGDVIFRMGIGRTDLAGGDLETLLKSIREQVFTLPNDVRLLPGHGPESTVGFERKNNPFLRD